MQNVNKTRAGNDYSFLLWYLSLPTLSIN